MKAFNPKKYGDFTQGEIIFIIQLSAALASIDEIEDRFYRFTKKQKKVSPDKIIEIQADFSSFIANKSKEYLKNVEGNPLAHPRVILDLCLEVYRECRKKVPSHTIKVADNVYETVEREDLKTALAAIKLAKDFQVELKKLKLEEDKKGPVPQAAPVEWELEDGLDLND